MWRRMTKFISKWVNIYNKLTQKEHQTKHDWAEKVQEIRIWLDYKMVYVAIRTHPRERDTYDSLEFWDIDGSVNLAQNSRPIVN